ncbi:MAG: hypothetical protein OXI39_00615 [Gemmatimonadota bacterium]|uniref:hypothetical protein n=1 Tax=Candidatus Palauibacter scopulicola TaxID=3056741 RepID=UPI00238CC17F|nr:hypothetical protein [Candidatus Palauibacter scopulicola]MDE2661494.1 hypothetical protein [Candidatus Palauibacter scopulicola]
MRRRIIATGILLAAPLAAQEDVALRAGIGMGSIVGNGGESITVPTVGVDFGFPLGSGLSLRPGVSYARMGTDVRYYAGGLEWTGSRSIDYVQTSWLLARPRIIGSGRLSLGVQAGPWLGIKVSCDNSGTFGPGLCEGADPGAEVTDYGLMGRLGLSHGITDDVRVSIDALYQVGLKDVIDYPPPEIGITVEGKEYTRLLAFQLGVVLKT